MNEKRAPNMRCIIRFGLLTLTIMLAMAVSNTSLGGFSAELISVVPVGPNFQYNYDLIFQTLPGRARVESGDFVTIYDVGVVADEFVSATAGSGFALGLSPLGADPNQIRPNDHRDLLNVTFTYVLPSATTVETVFSGFNILSKLGPSSSTSVRVDEYGSIHTDNLGADANRKINELGPIEVPPTLIPEPSTWALFAAALVWVRLRRRKAPAAGNTLRHTTHPLWLLPAKPQNMVPL